MRATTRRRIQHVLTRASALLLMLLLLFSAFYIALESGHSCTGEHCHVCHCIALSCNVMRLFSLAAGVLFLMLKLEGHIALRCDRKGLYTIHSTLLSRKTRFNN